MDRKIMTLRELSGILLLLVLLLTGLLVSRYAARQQEAIARQLDDSAWMALSGQWSDARKAADQARQQWEKGRNLRSVLGDHTPMEEIGHLFEALQISAAAGEKTEFARSCAQLASRIRAVGDAHRLTWQNVL